MFQLCRLMLIIFGLLVSLTAYPMPVDQNTLDILHDVNFYRKQHRLSPLILRADLSAEAYKHSLDMAQHRVGFGHDGFFKRVKHIYAHITHPGGAAENVAYHYKDGHDVVKNWLTSPHHLANIKGHYNYTGIGLARDSQGRLYFTQLFLLAG